MFKASTPFRALRQLTPLQQRVSPIHLRSPASRYPFSTATKMAGRVVRVTMFKLPKEEDQKKMMEQYNVLASKALKDGKPYILSIDIGIPEPDARTQGFTIVNKSEFASMEDMKYYDDQCPAHQDLKAFARSSLTVEGLITVYFHPQISTSLSA